MVVTLATTRKQGSFRSPPACTRQRRFRSERAETGLAGAARHWPTQGRRGAGSPGKLAGIAVAAAYRLTPQRVQDGPDERRPKGCLISWTQSGPSGMAWPSVGRHRPTNQEESGRPAEEIAPTFAPNKRNPLSLRVSTRLQAAADRPITLLHQSVGGTLTRVSRIRALVNHLSSHPHRCSATAQYKTWNLDHF